MPKTLTLQLKTFNIKPSDDLDSVQMTFSDSEDDAAVVETSTDGCEQVMNTLMRFHADIRVHRAMPARPEPDPENQPETRPVPEVQFLKPVAAVGWKAGGLAIDFQLENGTMLRVGLSPEGAQYLRSMLTPFAKSSLQ